MKTFNEVYDEYKALKSTGFNDLEELDLYFQDWDFVLNTPKPEDAAHLKGESEYSLFSHYLNMGFSEAQANELVKKTHINDALDIILRH